MAKFEVGEQVFIRIYDDVLRGTVHRLVTSLGLGLDRDLEVYAIRVRRPNGQWCYPHAFEDWMWRTTTQEIVNAWKAEVQGR